MEGRRDREIERRRDRETVRWRDGMMEGRSDQVRVAPNIFFPPSYRPSISLSLCLSVSLSLHLCVSPSLRSDLLRAGSQTRAHLFLIPSRGRRRWSPSREPAGPSRRSGTSSPACAASPRCPSPPTYSDHDWTPRRPC